MKRALILALVVSAALPALGAARPLRTAVLADSTNPTLFERIREAGATMVRINLSWADVAPERPGAAFDPADPADPAYDWTVVDRQVQLAVAHRLVPFLTVYGAPRWAEKDEPHPTHMGPYLVGGWKPNADELEAFAHAAALRYGGSFLGLPRVRYWEFWNEPNLIQYLSPQVEDGKLVAASVYRTLLNAFAGAMHAVHSDNVIVAGALSAFSFLTPYGRLGIAPMSFMQKLLCMSGGANPKPTCNEAVSLDAWSHHPWTSGGPTHHASEKGDISFGDLPKMKRLLEAAYRAGHIRSRGMPQFWISEFSWDTRPPDPHPLTAPVALQARWVAEALYRSWKLGVRVFTWLTIWDEPYPKGGAQAGLFFRNGEDLENARPKPAFWAFRFPFVAYRHRRHVSVWGRTPHGRPGKVVIQQRTDAQWRSIGHFQAGRFGIFSGRVPFRPLPKVRRSARPEANAAVYRDLVVSAAPMSYWTLDERSGSVAADTMKADDGRITGGVRLGMPGAFPGSAAIALDGKTGHVELGPVTNVHSVELWVKTRTMVDAAAFSNRNDRHAYTAFGVAGGLAHAYDDYPVWARAVADGHWHYLVYTYDSARSTGKVYVDGKLEGYAVWPRREGGARANLGYDPSTTTFFGGQIDEVAVYPYPLTPEQVRIHYAASGRRIAANVERGALRAVEVRSGIPSLPFSLHRPPDRYVLPFGSGGS